MLNHVIIAVLFIGQLILSNLLIVNLWRRYYWKRGTNFSVTNLHLNHLLLGIWILLIFSYGRLNDLIVRESCLSLLLIRVSYTLNEICWPIAIVSRCFRTSSWVISIFDNDDIRKHATSAWFEIILLLLWTNKLWELLAMFSSLCFLLETLLGIIQSWQREILILTSLSR